MFRTQQYILGEDGKQDAECTLTIVGGSVPVLLEAFPAFSETHDCVTADGGNSLEVSDLVGGLHQKGDCDSYHPLHRSVGPHALQAQFDGFP